MDVTRADKGSRSRKNFFAEIDTAVNKNRRKNKNVLPCMILLKALGFFRDNLEILQIYTPYTSCSHFL
jgi:DNA-directed RNA polymerase beta subunit